MVARLLKELIAEARRTADTAHAGAVHDLRVSVRRVTEALRIFGEEIPNARRMRKEIRAIREKAAAVRDRDVTRQLLLRQGLPDSDPACVYLAGQRDLAAAQLRQFLQDLLAKDRPRRWFRWIGEEL